MERVTFLLEPSQERLVAQLNPETVEVRRRAGLLRRRLPGGAVNAQSENEDALLFTGGGRTEVEMDLLFDLDLAGTPVDLEDVRDLTEPFFELTTSTNLAGGRRRIPALRFLWGKRWNMLAAVEAVSQRLERFDASGAPRRSWMRLRLVRLPEPMAVTAADARVVNEGAGLEAGSALENTPPVFESGVGPEEEGLGVAEGAWWEGPPGAGRLDDFIRELDEQVRSEVQKHRLE